MVAGDYERVEHELQRQLQHGRLEQHQQKVQMWRDLDDALTTQSLGNKIKISTVKMSVD